MKKAFALVLVLSLLASCAFAAQIKPLLSTDMESDLTDCMLFVGFTAQDMTETDMDVLIYDEVRYDAVEVSQLTVGDVLATEIGDVTVETLSEEEGLILVNGGSEEAENGITLWPDEGGTYLSKDYEYTCMLLRGQAQFLLADEVRLSYWYEEEDGSIAQENKEETVPAARLKDALIASGNEECTPYSCVLTVEGGLVTEVTINYMP